MKNNFGEYEAEVNYMDYNPQDRGNPKYGNPDLGKGDINNPNPPLLDQFGKPTGQHLSICEDCGGYYWAYCPCVFRPGGKLNPPPTKPPNKWWHFWRKDK